MLSEKGQSQNGHTLLKYIYITFSKKNYSAGKGISDCQELWNVGGEVCVYKDKKVTWEDHRCRKQSYGYQTGERELGWIGRLGLAYTYCYIQNG